MVKFCFKVGILLCTLSCYFWVACTVNYWSFQVQELGNGNFGQPPTHPSPSWAGLVDVVMVLLLLTVPQGCPFFISLSDVSLMLLCFSRLLSFSLLFCVIKVIIAIIGRVTGSGLNNLSATLLKSGIA